MATRQIPITTGGVTSLIVVDNELFTTTAVLGNAGVYSSPPFAVKNGVISYGAFSDHTGSFVLQTSNDGVTWFTVGSSVAVTASTFASGNLNPVLALHKIVYTNGSTPQTSFTFAAYLNNTVGV